MFCDWDTWPVVWLCEYGTCPWLANGIDKCCKHADVQWADVACAGDCYLSREWLYQLVFLVTGSCVLLVLVYGDCSVPVCGAHLLLANRPSPFFNGTFFHEPFCNDQRHPGWCAAYSRVKWIADR